MFVVLFFAPLARGSDPLDALIEKEKVEYEDWTSSPLELPTTILLGNVRGIELYSDRFRPSREALTLCQPLVMDELIELNGGERGATNQVLNLQLSRVREILGDACLARPDDPFVAVGPGVNTLVALKDFLIKRERSSCPQTPSYSLWGVIDKTLPEAPLFFSTDIHLTEVENEFVPADGIPHRSVNPAHLEKPYPSNLALLVPFIEEYDVIVYDLGALNCDKIAYAKRRVVTPDDSDLPNEILISLHAGHAEILIQERVETKGVSGHLQLVGSMDFNKDGWRDLFIEGDHEECNYFVLFEGVEAGFKKQIFPPKRCGCP